jgi:cell division protein FtsL
MAKRAVRRRRGRSVFALGLLGFVLVATSVIWRRAHGAQEARALEELERTRVELEAEKAKLESEIRDASSQRRLGPIAEQRLRLRVPDDSQVIIIPRSTNRSTDRRDDAAR